MRIVTDSERCRQMLGEMDAVCRELELAVTSDSRAFGVRTGISIAAGKMRATVEVWRSILDGTPKGDSHG